ncbi:hypothetical protein FQN50_004429 [Emmonsiellopsis sp. PD_5]|nr:hypothetical protein FQN50_004429 [Emmonsiellopsis sp. PD_5]
MKLLKFALLFAGIAMALPNPGPEPEAEALDIDKRDCYKGMCIISSRPCGPVSSPQADGFLKPTAYLMPFMPIT